MQEVESEFEVFVVPEAVGLPFEDLDFVIEPFQGASGNGVIEVGQEPLAMVIQGIGQFGEVFVGQAFGLGDPGVQEILSGLAVSMLPESPQVFFEQVGLEQGLVDLHHLDQPSQPWLPEIFQALEEQETAALDRLAVLPLEFPVHVPSGLIDGPIGYCHHVIGIVDDIHLGEDLPYRPQVGGGHVHGHGQEFDPATLEGFQEWDEGLCVSAFLGVNDAASLEVHHHGHVMMPLADGELIDRQVAHPGQFAFGKPFAEMLLEQLLDHVPAHAQQQGHMFDGGDAAQVHHETVKGLEAPSLSLGEFDRLPEGVAAAQAILLMAVQDDELGSPAHRQCPEDPLETNSLPV